MDLTSDQLVLVGVTIIVIVLIRTLTLAGKAINSSDKFPRAKNYKKEDKIDNEGSP